MQMYIRGTKRPTLELPGANKPVLAGQKAQKGLFIEMAEGLHPISKTFCLQCHGQKASSDEDQIFHAKDVCSNTK